ncbi:MAG: hypothetical protein RLZZ401_2406, partial [Pseudomonadota bacterium]
DGGSTDGTVELIQQHGSRVTHQVSEPDRGIYDAMNKGIRAATGDVIGILNSDDHYAHPDVVATVALRMAFGHLDALLGDVAFFRAADPTRLVRRYRSAGFTPARLAWGWMPAHPGLFVRRAVFDGVGLYRTDYRIAGDYEWIARAFKPGALRYAHEDAVLVHMQTGGVSTRSWRNNLLLNQEVLRACRENGIHTNWLMLLSKYPRKLLEYLRP